MPRVNTFSIPADDPERAVSFYREVFGWKFEVGWEYDTPNGRERFWTIATGATGEPGIDGGLTRREFPGQPIGVGIEVVSVDATLARVTEHGGTVIVPKVPLPKVGYFGVCKDSEENTFVVYESDESVVAGS